MTECGCRIIFGEPQWESKIQYCPMHKAAPELLEACQAEKDADIWDAAVNLPTVREMKLARIPIWERWHSQIEELHPYLNSSDQLRQLAKMLRQAAIAKVEGKG